MEGYKAGDNVEVLVYGTLQWRPAILMKHAPYSHGKTDGWYVQYTTGIEKQVADIIPSQGGWVPVQSIRYQKGV